MNVKVSILIPAYNAESWIQETIASALSQTWPNSEIIVVDDGSTDNTFQVANRFRSKYVKVIRQENMGASAARNKAFSLAQGNYIQWLDADDLLAPDKISQQLKYHNGDEDSLLLLSSAFGYFYYRRYRAKFVPTKLWQDLKPIEWLIIRFTDKVWIHPGAWLVSRRLTERSGPWDERLSLNDDGEYFCRVVAASDEIKFVPESKSFYRQVNVNSLSNTFTHKSRESLFLSLELCYRCLLALENSEKTRTAAFQHLQICLINFYPEESELLIKIFELARELGGDLTVPKLQFKYTVIKELLGWKVAKNLIFEVPRFKKKVYGHYDALLNTSGSQLWKWLE